MSEENLLSQYNGDVYLYYGDINRKGYSSLSQLFENKTEKKQKACLVLVTLGGDPNAGYRIARAANHHYKNFEILIPDICKSAGTLVCIGAKRLIFGDRGELGPLDIQLSKPDEMFENMSGLDILQAISALETELLDSFRRYFVDIRAGSQIKTKTAAEIATKLADGFIAPIASRIDPVTLGEHQRAMQIAFEYGERLEEMADSLKENALRTLVGDYPSHGFVIDRKEAGTLFKNVSSPDETTIDIYNMSRDILERERYPDPVIVIDLIDLLTTHGNSLPQEEGNEKDGPHDRGEEGDVQEDDGIAAVQSETNQPDGIIEQPGNEHVEKQASTDNQGNEHNQDKELKKAE